MRKRFLLPLLVLLMTTLSTHAYDFQSGDLYYNITSENTVEVTYQEYWSSANYQGLTTATIPETVTNDGTTYSVTSIGEEAFVDCRSLTSITIPNSVTSIGYGAFHGCSTLTSITIPNSVTSIELAVLAGCDSLTSIVVESGNTIYDSRDNCNAIIKTASNTLIAGCQSTIIPNSVTSIGQSAFYYCSSLTSITIPNSVTSIGKYAFASCKSLTSITIPNSVTSIGGGAFEYCESLTTITIPNSVTSIEGEAFYGCTSLTSITIPNSVTSIGEEAFRSCSSLTSITIPNSVTSIGEYAFSDCSSLTSITIPNSVKTIREGVFNNNVKLAKVTIGTRVETIEANAFAGCMRLYDIYCYPTYPPFAETNSFANYNVYVYVPCENQRDYTLDVVWGEFKFIECIGSEVVVLPDDEVTVAPSYEDVTITWPSTDGAETYTLVITKGDITFCTLVFNAQGQLVSIAFKPRRQNASAEEGMTPANYAEQTANGFRFKVTGLDEGTDYAYTLTVRNAANSVLETYTGEFTTQSDTQMGIHESAGDNTTAGQAEKILRNGQVLILRNGETYDIMGQQL